MGGAQRYPSFMVCSEDVGLNPTYELSPQSRYAHRHVHCRLPPRARCAPLPPSGVAERSRTVGRGRGWGVLQQAPASVEAPPTPPSPPQERGEGVRQPAFLTLLDDNFAVYGACLFPVQAEAMADIFISYSSQQRDVTRPLAAAIEAEHGIGSVWWDQAGLRGGDQFSPEITRALDAAKAVVVVWTRGSVASDWVYAEAVRAANQRKVVPVRAADLDPKLIP